MGETIYDVFISYSSKDQKVAEGICAYLEQRHIRCFVAFRDIPKGKVWASAIVEALDASHMMIVVFSKNFNISEQVDREIELAAEDHKPILTFRLSNDAFKGAKKYYLKNINWIDAFPEPDKCFGELAEEVGKLIDISHDDFSLEERAEENIFIANSALSCLKVKADMNCIFYIDGEECAHLKAGIIQKFPLAKGEYELMFVSEDNDDDRLELEFEMPEVDKLQKVNLSETRNARLQKEAEARRIAKEEERKHETEQKANEERKRCEEEERAWYTKTLEQISNPLVGHISLVESAAFSPDGRRIVSASADNTIRIWDAQTGKQIGNPLEGHKGCVFSAAFSPDGKRIVSASDDRAIRIWDAQTGKQIGNPLEGHTDGVYSASFSPDGKRIVSASSDKTIRIWGFPDSPWFPNG